MPKRTPLARLAVVLALMSVAHTARAVLIASESFTDSPGPLANRGSGTGWNGGWITGQPSVFTLQASGLAGGFGSTGGSLFYDGSHAVSGTGARIFRQLDLGPSSAALAAGLVDTSLTAFAGLQPSLGRPGTTVWFGIVFNGGTAGNGLGGVQYLDQVHLYHGLTHTPSALAQGDNNKDGEAIAIGRGNLNTVWNYERTCAHDDCPSGSSSSSGFLSTRAFDSATHWLVMRFDFVSTATTQVTLWLDPPPDTLAPPNASAVLMGGQAVVPVTGLHFDWIELGGQTAQFAFDEVRFATTFGELSYGGTLAAPARHPAQAVRLALWPSPSAGETTVAFELAQAQPVSLQVVDVSGRVVRTLADGVLDAGAHTVRWDGRDARGTRLASGVYLIRLRERDRTRVERLVHLR